MSAIFGVRSLRYKNYEGVTYEFFGMAAVVDKVKEAQQFAAEGLKADFETLFWMRLF